MPAASKQATSGGEASWLLEMVPCCFAATSSSTSHTSRPWIPHQGALFDAHKRNVGTPCSELFSLCMRKFPRFFKKFGHQEPL